MYTVNALKDVHERTHRSLQLLLDHCATFTDEEQVTELEHFAYPTLRLQLDHLIGAERYWVGVLNGEMLADELDADHESMESLRSFREVTRAATAAYLDAADEAEVNTSRKMDTWSRKQVDLVPAHVILRTQTHIFQHQGQIAAMSRFLGRPFPPGLDFPLG